LPDTASKEPGCSPAASVQPPTSSTGAAAEETKPHHGTLRTITTISEPTQTQAPPALLTTREKALGRLYWPAFS